MSRHYKKRVYHGMAGTRLYNIYTTMINRCYNPDESHKKYYKDITICKEWLSDFMTFYNWAINNGYNNTLTIDRIDTNKGYSPSNCRWVDMKTQNQNRRCCFVLLYNDKWLTVKQIAKIEGIDWYKAHTKYVRVKKTRLPKKYLYDTKGDKV